MKNHKLQGSTSKEVEAVNSKEFHQQHQLPEDDEIDLAELWLALWNGKGLILVITFVAAISAVFYAKSQPNIYRATTLLAPAGEQGARGLGNMTGQLGGLASLAGINLGGGRSDKTGLALEVLKSRAFIESFITKRKLLVNLFAVESWNAESDTLIFNKELYDSDKEKWLIENKLKGTVGPSPWTAFKAFINVLTVAVDQDTGLITISIEHHSPEVAKQWLLWLVSDINETMREQDKIYAQNSIDFLTAKLELTQLADMQTMFYQLIEEQTKTIMLAEVSKEYVLKTIDPANAPDEKAKPKRAIIVVFGTMLGGMLAIVIVLIRHFRFRKKQ